MKPPVGGMSHKELHGSGSALTVGGPGDRAHSMHTPSAETAGGEGTREDARRAASGEAGAAFEYRQSMGGGMTKEGEARAVNEKRYQMAGDNPVSASRVKDTDEVIASARGDAPGTEYAENESGEAVPTGSNMAGQRKP